MHWLVCILYLSLFVNINFKSNVAKWIFTLFLFLICPLIPVFKIFSLRKQTCLGKKSYKDSDIALPQYLLEKHKHNEELDQPLVFKSDLLLIDATLDSIPQLR